MEGDDSDVTDWSVCNIRGRQSSFVDACDHEVVCELWVKVSEGRSPVGHHSVIVKAPEFVLGVGRGGRVE